MCVETIIYERELTSNMQKMGKPFNGMKYKKIYQWSNGYWYRKHKNNRQHPYELKVADDLCK